MREVKFRAWCKESNKMFYSDFHVDFKGRIFWWDGDGYNRLRQDVELMQFTGLKDKNGKEIYEGDVVRYRNMDNIPYRKGQIMILGGGTTANALETKINTTDGYIYPLSNEREFPITKSEIIGNIYENPELLTQ